MTSGSQKSFILNELKTNGFITRNFCLKNFISRAGALILMLKQDGYEIKGENIKTEHGRDYKYSLINFDKNKLFN
jgi:hypothetical protein